MTSRLLRKQLHSPLTAVVSAPRDEALAQEVIRRLKVCEGINDHEDPHMEADHLLTLLLEALGYADVAEAYHTLEIPWYYA